MPRTVLFEYTDSADQPLGRPYAARPDRAAGGQCLVLFDQSEEGRFLLPECAPSIALASVTSSAKPRRGGGEHMAAGSLRRGRAQEPRCRDELLGGSRGYQRLLEAPRVSPAAARRARAALRSTADVAVVSVSNSTSLSVKHAAFLWHPPSVSLTLAVHDPSIDLHALLEDVGPLHLRALALDNLAPEAPSNARALAIMLLEHTPTLQHVTWKHLDSDPLSPGALPALCTLHVEEVPGSPGPAGRALLRGGAALDSFGSIRVDADALEALAHMRGEALRRLEVASFESIAVLVRAVRLIPRLRLLHIPAVDYWHEHSPVTPAPVHLGESVKVLAALPELEVFRGVSTFRDPESTTIEENDERACDILSLCPRLQQVEHWDLEPARAITLAREGDRVMWRVDEVSRADGGFAWGTCRRKPRDLVHVLLPVIVPALFFMPTSDEYLPLATQHQPESEPASASESPVSKFGLSPRTLLLPPDQTFAPLLSSPTLLSLPLLEISTLDSLPVALSPDQSFKSSLSVSLPRPCEFKSTPVSAVDVASLSSESPEFSESKSSQGEPIPFLLASPEAPSNAPTSAHSTLLQRPPGLKTVDSVSSPLDITPAFRIVFRTLTPTITVSLWFLLRTLVTAAVLALMLNISPTVPTFVPNSHARGTRLVFDPGDTTALSLGPEKAFFAVSTYFLHSLALAHTFPCFPAPVRAF
ncbi:hypothetical protein EDB89DRAFT_2196357 [Lactarius sanguifluus]|nr:hypothetical protein EDB89DRAFT_2196357 [Lactarius sanguifluus]